MTSLKQYGYTETEQPPAGLIPGRITEQQRDQYTVITDMGELTAQPKGSFIYDAVVRADLPCVGDFVLLHYNDSGPSMITRLLPRRTKFSRADYSGHKAGYAKNILEQVIAANFDYVFILTSLNRDFNVSRILRYLTQARQSGGQAVVVLTKADLVGDPSPQVREVEDAAPGVPVHAISSHTGFGLDALDVYLQPVKTIAFLGMSGVGKSSLLNTLSGEHKMTVRETRNEDASKGRHTTTHRQLFMLPSGAMVIDTPGMRELGLIGAEEGIRETFSGVEALFLECRFTDCRHKSEPGCAVQKALTDGTLSWEEWERYLSLKRENKFADDRAGYMREKSAMGKSIAMWSRRHNKTAKGNKKKR
jgi:ribosome biogenesis GTPase